MKPHSTKYEDSHRTRNSLGSPFLYAGRRRWLMTYAICDSSTSRLRPRIDMSDRLATITPSLAAWVFFPISCTTISALLSGFRSYREIYWIYLKDEKEANNSDKAHQVCEKSPQKTTPPLTSSPALADDIDDLLPSRADKTLSICMHVRMFYN